MKQRVPVTVIMAKKVITLPKTDNLENAELLFRQHKIRHIPVVNGKTVIGMLSYTDLLRISFADSIMDDGNVDTEVYNLFTIEQVMAKNVTEIDAATTIKEAAEILASKEFHALPVCKRGKLVGIITTTDLIRYLLSQY
ncbi:CBS domain-containing protein [Epilithonimonas mollis]|uniref:CBS domain-containing protein n=1 Tax=Epilithonimonas mollis TaxID=216903 RepID=A0A1M6PT86_9FLAO|nr:CBS domain-containing protein [Epilithonimonas mollis]SHK11121.1 CBS domain-containing protein [Epilithonimonas mollis]